MAWRVARSLETLREQFNDAFPDRSTASDGGIGDAAHASRSSDHNPWHTVDGIGVVTARDFTHDPAHGMDIDRLTDELAASRDPRIKYLIANGLIMDTRPGYSPWRWVPYRGANPHRKHFHISVNPHNCDDDTPWNLPSFTNTAPNNQEDDVSYDDAKRAIVDVLWRERHPSRVRGSDVKLSLAEAALNGDLYGFENRAMLAAQAETIRTLAAAITGSDFNADELIKRIDDTVRNTIADATINVDVNVARGADGNV
ncbi:MULTISPECIES: hypothetical protein [Bacteria]|uniref:Uncharacterized protein n=2 Tax=Bacteria TaxID=2 RepID=A0A1I4UWM8_9BURK|nr:MULTISPECIES: hypothetical protein [Bacteria]SFE67838.1 hypothetical protein SAMN05216506_113135 [Saccharopolyspora kobensis]SFM93427.1 hypothetical protein SAMN02982985_05845 [Rugamonas rubra]